MSIDFLFTDFDRLIQSSESVHRLRRFILDLAVRGKLVPQDPNDDPALELLKRIEQTRDERHKRKLALIEIDPTKTDFDLPDNWNLAPLGVLGGWAIGTGFPKSEQGRTEGPYFFLKVSDMNLPGNEKVIVTAQNRIDDEVATRIRAKVHSVRTIIFPKIGGAIATNKRRILSRPSAIDNNCLGITISSEINLNWAYLLLTSLDFTRYQAGTAVPALQQGVLERISVAIPPFPEQRRIVAKVDELMAFCDRLEATRAEREATRDRLTAASLARLNAPGPNPAMFQHDVAFALNNLAPLTTRPDQIKALRQAILNLAVRGKLVRQDPNDEPASELLKRIATEKARLAKSGTIRKRKTSEPAPPGSLAFELPSGWAAAKLSDVLTELQTGPFGSSLHQNDYEIGGTPVINPASMRDGEIVPVERMAVGPDTLERLATFKLQVGDIVMGRRGEMGRCAVVTEQENGWLCGTGSLILRLPQCLYPEYLAMLIGSPYVREYLGGFAVGATMQNLNQSILLKMSIALPPLAEQHRIIAKVNELMALCDRLEASLSAGDHNRGRLAGTLLYDGLKAAPDGKVAT